MIERLRGCTFNEENITEFLGELERRGLVAISNYGKLVSEQLKAEKGSGWEIQKQIDELSNIITLENVHSMNNCAQNRSHESPSELLARMR